MSLPLSDEELREIAEQILLAEQGGTLSITTVRRLMAEAVRARKNERQLIARVRLLKLGAETDENVRRLLCGDSASGRR
jgi:hypothetical protein